MTYGWEQDSILVKRLHMGNKSIISACSSLEVLGGTWWTELSTIAACLAPLKSAFKRRCTLMHG